MNEPTEKSKQKILWAENLAAILTKFIIIVGIADDNYLQIFKITDPSFQNSKLRFFVDGKSDNKNTQIK